MFFGVMGRCWARAYVCRKNESTPPPCSNDIVPTKIYGKCDDFDFKIVNFPFLDGDVSRSTSFGGLSS